jgi:polyisoprenoid-binding protein YceI
MRQLGGSVDAVALGAFVRSLGQRSRATQSKPTGRPIMTNTTSDPQPVAPALEALRLPAAGTFTLDPRHTSIGFIARHLMVAKVHGHFTDFNGSIVIADDPVLSAAEATIMTASVDTSAAQRDADLRSANFFDCDRYATMTFCSTSVLPGAAHTYTVLGELTIKDQTRTVRLDVEYNGQVIDPWGQQRIAVTATAEVDRRDFGLNWNVPLEGGGLMVGNTVKIEIEAEAVRQSS